MKYPKINNKCYIRLAQSWQILKDVEYQKRKKNKGNLNPDQILIFTEVVIRFQTLIFYLLVPIDCDINNGGCEEKCIHGVNSEDR